MKTIMRQYGRKYRVVRVYNGRCVQFVLEDRAFIWFGPWNKRIASSFGPYGGVWEASCPTFTELSELAESWLGFDLLAPTHKS